VRTYDAEIGSNALELKQRQGDRATPEGRYRVVKKKDRGESRYHRALLLDYPNAADRERFAAAKRRGEIPRGAGIGGLIEIHGEGGRGQNWTEGCVALSNRDMDDLFRRVGTGTRVTIVGGDGRDGAFSDLLARVGGGAENGKP
jgi:murein L,D-transpeptidase YafK